MFNAKFFSNYEPTVFTLIMDLVLVLLVRAEKGGHSLLAVKNNF